ncbi:hypothetical protein P3T75_12665 [Enterococcus montenegrensis]|uniref:hypothetical protein n=1 Tax=Enterococcus montenegrensis TaxID=3031993 RepID=UPI00249EE901|nr:hypothetical protein [Enterococcus montenegrensis]WHA09111.1 hypothetical protein P3T75_12665 [Enterococcus montenegrensis]
MNEICKSQLSNLKILLLGAGLILFTQQIKFMKNPESLPVNLDTIIGVLVLVSFAFLGMIFAQAMKKTKIKILAEFPVLGWVSIISLVFCLGSDFFIEIIGKVDFLAITTPVLAFAGISVANSLGDLGKNSWKYIIVASFVFIGSYVGRVILAQLGLMIVG